MMGVVDCSKCEGTGLFAKATWDDPEIPCDDCQGTGEDNPEEEENPEDIENEDGPLVDCRNCRDGIVDGVECPWCGGTGTVKGVRR